MAPNQKLRQKYTITVVLKWTELNIFHFPVFGLPPLCANCEMT